MCRAHCRNFASYVFLLCKNCTIILVGVGTLISCKKHMSLCHSLFHSAIFTTACGWKARKNLFFSIDCRSIEKILMKEERLSLKIFLKIFHLTLLEASEVDREMLFSDGFWPSLIQFWTDEFLSCYFLFFAWRKLPLIFAPLEILKLPAHSVSLERERRRLRNLRIKH